MERTALDVRTVDLATLREMPPEELAEALRDLTPTELATLFTRLGDDDLAELIAELEPYDSARLLGKLSRAQAADLLEEMDPDDAADVVEELSAADAEAVLVQMEPEEAEDLRELLAYPPESAGGLMTPAYVSISPDLTANEALAALRALSEEAETIYYVYVTEPVTNRLLGVLSLRSLVLTRPATPVRDLMLREVVKVQVDADQEEAARLLERHHLLALPVVDAGDKLLGIITADDAADVLLEEAGEDVERLGGSQPLEEPYLRASVFHLFRKRIIWLMVLFLASAYTATVISYFEATLAEKVALALFIPLLISTGGNTGSQTVTTLVRAMGVGEVQFDDLLRVLRRELTVGLLLGLVMAGATYVRAWTMGESVGLELGLVVAATALFIVLWATAVAAILPLLLERLGVDPAVVSAPLITTLVDGTGLFLYFTIARAMLGLP